ncbi:hypothetical protein BZA77DRAFT_322392 [Pyronema omphalodes]|nr:hypothetical protein BZA77DRAFT_322392 [Pyronema omphalodes]
MPSKISVTPSKSLTKSNQSSKSDKSSKPSKPSKSTPAKPAKSTPAKPTPAKSTTKRPSSSLSSSPSSSSATTAAPAPAATTSSNDASNDATTPSIDPMEIFRRHFESRFEAIEVAPVVPVTTSSSSSTSKKRKSTAIDEGSDVEDSYHDDDEEEEDEDSDEEEQVLEVVHNDSRDLVPSIKEAKKGLRAFMKSAIKPETTETSTTKKSKKGGKQEDAEEDNEQENLHNDLALQRLLAESHLLDKDSGSLEATGAQRLKAQQLRIEALGGKKIEQKMGMRMKQGIEAKKTDKEKKRRREAKEAGVVLEKERKVKKVRTRTGGVGDASVGKWKGGALVLSKKDIGDIVGRKTGGSKKGGKRK